MHQKGGIYLQGVSSASGEFPNAALYLSRGSGENSNPDANGDFAFVMTGGSMFGRQVFLKGGGAPTTGSYDTTYGLAKIGKSSGMKTKAGNTTTAGEFACKKSDWKPENLVGMAKMGNVVSTSAGQNCALAVRNSVGASGWNVGHFMFQTNNEVHYPSGYIETYSTTADNTPGKIRLKNGDGGNAGIMSLPTDTRNVSQSVAIQDSTCSTILNLLSPKLLEFNSGSKTISFEFGAAKTALATAGTASERAFFSDGGQITDGDETEQQTLGDITRVSDGAVLQADVVVEAGSLASYLELVAEEHGGVAADYTWTANGNLKNVLGHFDETRLIPFLVGGHKANRARLDTIEGTYATQAYVDTAVSDLVDAAPGTLDTLNELAAALGDDANYAATTTAAIGAKLDASAASTFGLTLIDDADAATARTTLGLGTAATTASTDYATAAQGATADAALPATGAAEALDVDHLITLSGVAAAADDLGTFTGTTITDNSTVKTALQELETELEGHADGTVLLDGSNIPGPFGNDSAAATGGVAVGALYRNSNGTVHWRVS